MQATIGDTGVASSIALLRRRSEDLDFLAARLHGRRSQMAESERLDGLCHIRNLPEFIRTIYAEADLNGVAQFQRFLISKLADEIYEILSQLSGRGADLVNWMLVRFQVENLKILARQCLTKTTIDMAGKHLIPLPGEFALNEQGLAGALSPEDFIRYISKGHFRESLGKILKIIGDNPKPFFFEGALDRVYFQELLARTNRLTREDRDTINPMVCQEVDMFLLMLVARGKFNYRMTEDILRSFHVRGSLISHGIFTAMLGDPDLDTSVSRVAERVLDEVPSRQGPCNGSRTVDTNTLELLAWRRFFRLSNMAFRHSHTGLGAVAGYIGLRRAEVANLITISEGIIRAMPPEKIRSYLIQENHGERTRV